MLSDVHFSSASDMWETPQDLFDKWNAMYSFELDVCATPENAKCDRYFDKEINGLNQQWRGVCWMNPPYGNPEFVCKANCKKEMCRKRGFHNLEYKPGIIDWMKKAYESSLNGATVVCLVPSRTDTEWWHEYAMKGDIKLIRGRLKFNNHKNSAPFPSAIVVFKRQERASGNYC